MFQSKSRQPDNGGLVKNQSSSANKAAHKVQSEATQCVIYSKNVSLCFLKTSEIVSAQNAQRLAGAAMIEDGDGFQLAHGHGEETDVFLTACDEDYRLTATTSWV